MHVEVLCRAEVQSSPDCLKMWWRWNVDTSPIVVDKCSTETKSQVILMVFVMLLTCLLCLQWLWQNRDATYLMSTPHGDEDCIPFMLNEHACLDSMLRFEFMQSRRAKIHVLSKDRIFRITMHPEHCSEPQCIIRQKYIPLSTPWWSITLWRGKNTDIDCISKITMESCQSMMAIILLGSKCKVHLGT